MSGFMTLAKGILPKPIKEAIKRTVHRFRNRPFKPYLKKKNVEGVTFDFLIGDHNGRAWYDLGANDPEWLEMRFIRDHIIQPATSFSSAGRTTDVPQSSCRNGLERRGKSSPLRQYHRTVTSSRRTFVSMV